MSAYIGFPLNTTNRFVSLAMERAKAEREIIGAIASDPARALPLIKAAGIGPEHFDQDDARVLFIVLTEYTDRDKETIYHLARRALQLWHLWDPTARAFNDGLRHSDETLTAWFDTDPAPLRVPSLARKILSIQRRQMEAADFVNRAAALLRGEEPEPLKPPWRAVNMHLVKPRKWRKVYSHAAH